MKEKVGRHKNIVAIEDVFFEEPPFYIVMEYVSGDNLSDWCKARGGAATIPLEIKLDVIAQAADALRAAHDCGVIHRDVKPQNIIIHQTNGTPQAKLTDFGIGKVISEEVLAEVTRLGFTQTLVSTGTQSGTLMYMAPEIVAGRAATTRSDIYSLGVVFYQLLVGDFSRPLATDWQEGVSDPLLRDHLRHCFAGDPDKRFVSVKELADNLRALEQRRRFVRRHRLLILSLICVFWTALILLGRQFPQLPFLSTPWHGEQAFEDLLRREGRKTPTRPDFVFLGIDERMLVPPPFSPAELENNRAFQLIAQHPYPWSREVWAILLERVFGAGARLVIFDLIFNNPNEGDKAFADALAKYRDRVVVGANIDSFHDNQIVWPNSTLIPPPAEADQRVGYANFWRDPGRERRRWELLDAKMRATSFFTSDRQLAGQSSFPGEQLYASLPARGLEQLGHAAEVPRDQRGHLLRFSAADAYPPRSLYEVFDPKLWRGNFGNGAFFKDKVIVVGAAAQSMHDFVSTPLDAETPGAALQLQVMAAALGHEFLWLAPLPVVWALVMCAGLIAWALVAFVRQPLLVLVSLSGITIVYLAIALVGFNLIGLLLTTVPVLTAFLLCGLCALVWDNRMRQKEQI